MLRRRFFALWLALGLLLPLLADNHSSAYPYEQSSRFKVQGSEAVLSPQSSALRATPPAFANARFEQMWSRTDLPVARGEAARSWLWGPQPGETRTEPFAGAPGGVRTVQYFDKARMEVNSAVTDPNSPWSTTTGLLVVELVSGLVQTGPSSYERRAPASVPVAGDVTGVAELDTAPRYASFREVASLPGGPNRRVPSAVGSEVLATIDRAGKVGALPAGESSSVRYSAYAPESGHNIPDVFARFMESEGLINEGGTLRQSRLFDPVYLLGYPISEAYWTSVPVSGKPVRALVQLYERRVLTYIPSFTAGWQVQMGNVGQHYYTWRYARAQQPVALPTPVDPPPGPTPTATLGPGADDMFMHVAGNRLYYQGKPVNLKGTNYWLHKYPFVYTWVDWDGFAARAELQKAKELGVNVIRIGIPYDTGPATRVIWGADCRERDPNCDTVRGPIVNRMTQLLQIASEYGMKVLFTLFEWSDEFPAPGTAQYAKHIAYLEGIVGPLSNDDRILGWDLHNEPEHYDTWLRPGGKAQVIAWTDNIAQVVRSMDRRHLITVGMGHYENLWAVGAGGKRIIDIVDIVSFHCYNAGALRTQIDATVARTNKPVLLEEMGWPTGPEELRRPGTMYDEATQQFLYKSMLGDVKASSLVGVIQWTLWDYDDLHARADPRPREPSVEEWFGLVRLDGSFKPAATDFRESYTAAPLWSRTRTDVPLSRPQRDE